MLEPGGGGGGGGGGGQGGYCPLPIFSRSVNPIPSGGGQIIPTYF